MELYRKYFTSESVASLGQGQPNWGVHVLNAGHNLHPAARPYPDAAHPGPYRFNWQVGRVLQEYQLVYIAAGRGLFEAEHLGCVAVEPGTAFLLFPDTWHRYKPLAGSGWEEYWVGFTGPYAGYLMDQECFQAHSPLIFIGFNKELLDVFVCLLDTLKGEGQAFSQLSSCLTIQLLSIVYASALLKQTPQRHKEQVINNLRYKIHEQWATDLDMHALAAQHHVSYSWFRRTFKEVAGVSPGQYLLNLRLEKACQLLRETHMTITEITFATGFESEYHFSRIFKKKMLLAPSRYRQQNQPGL